MALKTGNFKKNSNGRTVRTIIGSALILIIVVISFVLAPTLSKLGSTSIADVELGSYGKEKITFSFLKETPFKNELAALSNNSSDSMDLRLAQVAYKRAVADAVAVDEFNSNGYNITKEQLDEAVLNSGYFNVNGSFSSKVYKNTTESQKQALRESVARELKINSWQYHTYLQQKRSSDYLKFISAMSDKKRSFNYVTFEYSEYPDNLVLDYAKQDASLFTELSLSRITVDKVGTANTILDKIATGESTFEDLAAQYSTDNFKNNGGKISSATYAYELESVFGLTDKSKVLEMKVDDAPIIIENEGKVILLKLNSEIIVPDFTDLSVVRNYMLTYERGIIEDYFYKTINSVTDNNLLSLGKDIKNTGLFSINYGGEQTLSTSVDRVSQDSLLSKAVSNENFYTTLFTLKPNTISEPVVLGDTISVFKLDQEVTDETNEEEYVLYSLDRAFVNYKTLASDNMIQKSEKYTDNFYKGYFEILRINQGL